MGQKLLWSCQTVKNIVNKKLSFSRPAELLNYRQLCWDTIHQITRRPVRFLIHFLCYNFRFQKSRRIILIFSFNDLFQLLNVHGLTLRIGMMAGFSCLSQVVRVFVNLFLGFTYLRNLVAHNGGFMDVWMYLFHVVITKFHFSYVI